MIKQTAPILVAEFEQAFIKQWEAIRHGTSRQARYYGDRTEKIARKLLSMGEDAHREFATLLYHPIPDLRLEAAVYLLHVLPEQALAAFREAAAGDDDFLAECARMRIREWEEHPERYGRRRPES
jgi:hypothetical protein